MVHESGKVSLVDVLDARELADAVLPRSRVLRVERERVEGRVTRHEVAHPLVPEHAHVRGSRRHRAGGCNGVEGQRDDRGLYRCSAGKAKIRAPDVEARILRLPAAQRIAKHDFRVIDLQGADLRVRQASVASIGAVGATYRLAVQHCRRRVETGVASADIADQAVFDTIQGVARGNGRVIEHLALGLVRVSARRGQRAGDAAELQVQARGIPGRIEHDGAIPILRPALHHRQRFPAAGRSTREVGLFGAIGVVVQLDQGNRDVPGFLQCVASKVAQRFVIGAERTVSASQRAGLVAGIAGECRIAARKRRGLVRRASRHVACRVRNGAVVAAAAEHDNLLVPARRHVDFELDGWRGRIHRGDRAGHLAVLARAKLAAARGRYLDGVGHVAPLVGKPILPAATVLPGMFSHDTGVTGCSGPLAWSSPPPPQALSTSTAAVVRTKGARPIVAGEHLHPMFLTFISSWCLQRWDRSRYR